VVAFIPIPGGRSLCPVKNRREGSFDKVAYQNFPFLYFHWANSLPYFSFSHIFQSTPLTNLPPIFIFPLFFTGQTTPLTKLSLHFLLLPCFSVYTLNKTFSLEGEEAQNREPKTGGKLHPIQFQILGDRSHWLVALCGASCVYI